MSPPSNRRPPPPDPPDTGNRVSKQKTMNNKVNTLNKTTRSSPMTVETLPKAEAIERNLSLSHHKVDENLPTSDFQMEDAIDNPRPTASAPQDQTTVTACKP